MGVRNHFSLVTVVALSGACASSGSVPTAGPVAELDPSISPPSQGAEKLTTMPFAVEVSGFDDGQAMPESFAFCAPTPEGKSTFGPNRNPEIRWSNLPSGTKSLALIVVDPDVPSKADDVNQAGKIVKQDLPRVPFYHWVLVDIPVSRVGIAEALDSDGVRNRGKSPGRRPYGITGTNGYTVWFRGSIDMEGQYAGYDGPCPPWNDERLHHYHFKLYALDVPSLGLSGGFTGPDAEKAMAGHILAEDSWVGTYTLKPGVELK
jgi:Raf kinase inhibitor-like YbhB/YbcL family protein